MTMTEGYESSPAPGVAVVAMVSRCEDGCDAWHMKFAIQYDYDTVADARGALLEFMRDNPIPWERIEHED